jgi:hypothetical protein
VDARHAEVWQLVDEHIEMLRRLPLAELRARASAPPEVERLDLPGGPFRRRTRVMSLGEDRVGVKVAVDLDGRKPRAERGVVLTPQGRLAPEWSFGNEPPRGNPFAIGPKATIAVVALAIVLFSLFFALI